MDPTTRRTLFVLFFVSGFASLVDQVVWTRMAFAAFGIILPVLSVVLSVFMLGLAIGSWAGGRLVGPLGRRTGVSAAVFYAGSELVIGVGAVAVPALFAAGQRVLLPAGQVDSARYLALSAVALAVAILPWCVCMGTTFPFMMAYVRERDRGDAASLSAGDFSGGSFSFLYLANVLGAMCGTLLTTVVLIEVLGFHRTLWVAAGGNFAIAVAAVVLGASGRGSAPATVGGAAGTAQTGGPEPAGTVARRSGRTSDRTDQAVLFTTGFVSMALEVVWSREFTAVLKTQVYSFGLIVFTYLGATFVGSSVYRRDDRRGRVWSRGAVFLGLTLSALLPAVVDDPRYMVQDFTSPTMDPRSAALLLASIVPLCGLLGYLTPYLIDRYAAGQPRRAGSAYAVNVVGCILGPLAACYLLLPNVNGRVALVLLSLPFAAFWYLTRPAAKATVAGTAVPAGPTVWRIATGLAVAAAVVYAGCYAEDFEESVGRRMPRSVVRRDAIASVVALGRSPRDKLLVVNGFGMTTMTPITKFIAHLPLALHRGPARSVLVICFGMGTTFRSSLSWGVDTTAVELVPSVPQMFGFFFDDAGRSMADPNGHVVIDDGRRYLSRCGRSFDVITVDPPPPVETAGSSLLFSQDFYALARRHLNPGGVVQMWYPGGPSRTRQAVVRTMAESFPHVRCFGSVDGGGIHLLGSTAPIDVPPAGRLAARMPPAARRDLLEWRNPPSDPADYLDVVLRREHDVADPAIEGDGRRVRVTDDRPFNEYYLLRRWRGADAR